MNIAYTMTRGRGDTDLLLAGLATALEARGHAPCGIVQTNCERKGEGPCDMDVRVLGGGPVIRISQNLGAGARGCRLDPDALEKAAVFVERAVADGADALIVNKFGRHEAEGGGFRVAIAEALSRDMPVLVGLNEINRPAFEAFTDGLAVALPPKEDALLNWLTSCISARSRAA